MKKHCLDCGWSCVHFDDSGHPDGFVCFKKEPKIKIDLKDYCHYGNN